MLNSNPLWWCFVGKMVEILSFSKSFSVCLLAEPRKMNIKLKQVLRGPLHSCIKWCCLVAAWPGFMASKPSFSVFQVFFKLFINVHKCFSGPSYEQVFAL